MLQSIVSELEKVRDALPPEAIAAFDAMTLKIAELNNEVEAATPTVVNLGTMLKNTVADNIANASADAIANFKSLKDIASSTLRSIAAEIVRSNIKGLLMDILPGGGSGGGGIFSSVISGVKSIFGFAEGGNPGGTSNIKRYANGGHIQGPGTGTSDSIPALVDGWKPIAVSTDEYIQPQRAVRHYGLAFMEAIRTLKFPKPNVGFALGGLVQAHRQARFATGGRIAGAAAGAGGQVAPNVILQLNNTGTPQRVERQEAKWEGRDMIVNVVLADFRDGGPISRSLNRGRG